MGGGMCLNTWAAEQPGTTKALPAGARQLWPDGKLAAWCAERSDHAGIIQKWLCGRPFNCCLAVFSVPGHHWWLRYAQLWENEPLPFLHKAWTSLAVLGESLLWLPAEAPLFTWSLSRTQSRGNQSTESSGFRDNRAWRRGETTQYSREVKKRWSLKTVWEKTTGLV